jgi:AcrR family transcriptional regulator
VTNTGVREYSGTVIGPRPGTHGASPPATILAVPAGAGQVERLPRHTHNLSRETVTRSQRSRILRAVAQTVAEKGYAAATVADVIGRAGVSRSTFYELYDGKESAFLDAYARIELVHRQLLDTSRTGATPVEMVTVAVRSHLESLAAEPAFTWMFFVEAVAAGPRILTRRRQATEHFLDVLTEMVEAARAIDPAIAAPVRTRLLGFVGGAREVIATHLLDADAATLPSLEPAVVDLARRLLLTPA